MILQVHECKAGCLRRYSEPTLPINRCRDGCVSTLEASILCYTTKHDCYKKFVSFLTLLLFLQYTQCTNEQCNGEDSCQHQVDLICPRQCVSLHELCCLIDCILEMLALMFKPALLNVENIVNTN